MTTTGACLCGNISYEIAGAIQMAGICHCKNCQRQTGSAYSTLGGVAKSDFTFKTGSTKVYKDSDTDSGGTVERHFCGDCGSPIYSWVPAFPDNLFLKTGTLDDTATFTPQFQVWCSSKQNWVSLEDGVPSMQKS